jgi:hypothetical protein
VGGEVLAVLVDLQAGDRGHTPVVEHHHRTPHSVGDAVYEDLPVASAIADARSALAAKPM